MLLATKRSNEPYLNKSMVCCVVPFNFYIIFCVLHQSLRCSASSFDLADGIMGTPCNCMGVAAIKEFSVTQRNDLPLGAHFQTAVACVAFESSQTYIPFSTKWFTKNGRKRTYIIVRNMQHYAFPFNAILLYFKTR